MNNTKGFIGGFADTLFKKEASAVIVAIVLMFFIVGLLVGVYGGVRLGVGLERARVKSLDEIEEMLKETALSLWEEGRGLPRVPTRESPEPLTYL
jgi:tetrahydromethanopterin S-methyltransferase subunit D